MIYYKKSAFLLFECMCAAFISVCSLTFLWNNLSMIVLHYHTLHKRQQEEEKVDTAYSFYYLKKRGARLVESSEPLPFEITSYRDETGLAHALMPSVNTHYSVAHCSRLRFLYEL